MVFSIWKWGGSGCNIQNAEWNSLWNIWTNFSAHSSKMRCTLENNHTIAFRMWMWHVNAAVGIWFCNKMNTKSYVIAIIFEANSLIKICSQTFYPSIVLMLQFGINGIRVRVENVWNCSRLKCIMWCCILTHLTNPEWKFQHLRKHTESVFFSPD